MEEVILALASLSNFSNCSAPLSFENNQPLLLQFVHINSLLNEFIQQDQDPKYIFQELRLFLIKEEEVLGPKKFRRLVQSSATIVLLYAITKLRMREVEKAVLCLTYYLRNCKKYLTIVIEILINIAFSLAQFSKGTFSAMEQYLLKSNQLLTNVKSSSCTEQTKDDLQLLQLAYKGIFYHYSLSLSKAKSSFSEMISRVTARIHEQHLKMKLMRQQTIVFFVLSTYFLSQTYRQLGQNDIANYNITQCIQFAETYLPEREFIFNSSQDSFYCIKKRVKLSRIQNKIQRIKSLHSINKTASQSLCQQVRPDFKISTKPIKPVRVDPGVLGKQLSNIFVLNEGKDYVLKRRTLKTLHKQTQNKENRIRQFQEEIDQFQQTKVNIHEKYQLEDLEEQLVSIQKKKKELKKQIKQEVWDVVGSLKPTKKIQSYMQAFKTAIIYQSTNKFYRFLCSEVSIMGQIIFFVMAKKFKSKLKRNCIKTIYIKGLRHQIQFLTHKINHTFHIKIYYVDSGPGVDDLVQVSQTLYNLLQVEPLEYHFECNNGKLLPLQSYLNYLNSKVLFQVKLFVVKLKKKIMMKRQLISYSKKEVFVTFQQYKMDLRYVLFITTKKISEQLYSHSIERIDNQKHQNPDYNLKINKNIVNANPVVFISDLDLMLTDEILERKQKHIKLINRLQCRLRLKISLKRLRQMKEDKSNKFTVITTKINQNLFTLTIRGFSRHFFIEHLSNKYPKVVIKNVEFSSLSFVNKLREKLLLSEDCGEHLKIIQKYFKLRNIYRKLTKKTKDLQLQNNFSSKFKISLCFAKKTKQIMYKGKKVDVAAMYMLTVRDFQVYPRTYLLRVFNLKASSLYCFDVELKIHMAQKYFIESNLDKVHQFIDIISYKQAILLIEGPAKSIPKSRRINSKSTILSNYSFNSGQDFGKQMPKQRLITRLQARESCAFSRNKKNSINFKMRHKSALKQKDILLIKKWIEDCNQNFDVSEESQIST